MPASVSINPTTGALIGEYPFDSEDDLQLRLASAKAGFAAWSRTTPAERGEALRRMAALLGQEKHALARLATAEMGKPIAQGRIEVEKCAQLCLWYAEHGAAYLGDEILDPALDARLTYRPLGAILAVMPWNFPFWQVMRGAVPILFGGNVYVLKPAPNVMGCTYALEALWKRAGLPKGVFSVLHARHELVSVAIADPRISAVAVTASARAGMAIAAQAGAALKKSVLELGGSDPFVVLEDADLDRAVIAAVQSRFRNSGQICVAAKRIILDARIAQAFTERFMAAVRKLKVGDPTEESTYIGPMARHDLREALHAQVQDTLRQGARALLGATKPVGPGSFYAPTVLVDVEPGMTAFREETFGPVAAITVARDEAHALELANDTEYGLSAAVWSGDPQRARRLAAQIQAGAVFVNGFSSSDARVPVGGIKRSGHGRELARFGMHEFMNGQVIWADKPIGSLP